MERETPPLLIPHDPEFSPSGPERGRTPFRVVHMPQEYQRLVTNPFLGVTGLVVWGAVARLVLISRNVQGAVALALCFPLLAFLLQYHCLDCGHTGWLFRWRRHACDAVLTRQATGQVRRRRGPTPTHQAVIWFYVLVIVAIIAAAVGGLSML